MFIFPFMHQKMAIPMDVSYSIKTFNILHSFLNNRPFNYLLGLEPQKGKQCNSGGSDHAAGRFENAIKLFKLVL
jgi:hypothetical protein